MEKLDFVCKNSYGTNFDAPDAHFYNLCLFRDVQAEKNWKSGILDLKSWGKNPKQTPTWVL
jgi:hypothetical protein